MCVKDIYSLLWFELAELQNAGGFRFEMTKSQQVEVREHHPFGFEIPPPLCCKGGE